MIGMCEEKALSKVELTLLCSEDDRAVVVINGQETAIAMGSSVPACVMQRWRRVSPR